MGHFLVDEPCGVAAPVLCDRFFTSCEAIEFAECSAIMLRMRAWRVVIIVTCARSRMLFASTVFHCSALSVET